MGHEGVIGRLRESILRGRLAHACLFVGPDGIGTELVARELARTLLCAAGTDEACGHCAACHKVDHGNHPDVSFVRRIERGAKGERKRQIVIDQVREEIQDPIGYKPFEGRYKVFVVSEADRMTEEAQNCLLKTLEEPPPHSLLILVAGRLEPFVDTVVSRCQVVRFRALGTEQVERILTEGHGLDAATARALGRLSEGSPGRALRYHAEGAYETTLWLLGELARTGPGGEFVVADELMGRLKDQGATLEDTRERVRPVLDLLTLAWRDLLFRASGYSEVLLTWGDGCEAVAGVAEGLDAPAARRLTELALEAREQLDANANLKLLLENLVLDTVALLRGREPMPAR